jgi:hypothetical protein
MPSLLPRRTVWVPISLSSPAISAFPAMADGSACASTFSRLARRSLTLRPAHSRCHQFVTRFTRGFSHFVTSITAPVASGWSVRRVGLSPTGKRRLSTAHATSGHSYRQLHPLGGSAVTSILRGSIMLLTLPPMYRQPPPFGSLYRASS